MRYAEYGRRSELDEKSAFSAESRGKKRYESVKYAG